MKPKITTIIADIIIVFFIAANGRVYHIAYFFKREDGF